MRIFVWHLHGSYLTALVQGGHEYLVPRLPHRGPWGRGRADTFVWPPSVHEVTPAEAASAEVDVVILQRPEERDGLAETWLGGRRPGIDVPAVYLEHNAPQGRVNDMRHPAADCDDLVVVHVTHFNRLFWDTGRTPVRVIEHGVVDPGYRYTGEIGRAAAAINEPVRRSRVTGTDLIRPISAAAGVDVDLFGMQSQPLGGTDVPQHALHDELARRRVYLHPIRWTSLGLTLIEAMHLGMPVVAVGSTEVWSAVPPGAGVVSTDVDVLAEAVRRYAHDPAEARECGRRARAGALARFGLSRFLDDWDRLFKEVSG